MQDSADGQNTSTMQDIGAIYSAVLESVRQEIARSGIGYGVTFAPYVSGLINIQLDGTTLEPTIRNELHSRLMKVFVPEDAEKEQPKYHKPEEVIDDLKTGGASNDILGTAALFAFGGGVIAGGAVLATGILAEGGVTNADTRASLASTLKVTADSMWDSVNQKQNPTDAYNTVSEILGSGIANAIAQASPGTQEHSALVQLQKNVLNHDYDEFLKNLSNSPFENNGFAKTISSSFDKLADKLDKEKSPEAQAVRRAGSYVASGPQQDRNYFAQLGGNLTSLGFFGGTAAVFGAVFGDPGSINQLATGNRKYNQAESLSGKVFLQSMINQDKSLALFGKDSRWANAFNKHYFGVKGDSSALVSGRQINWMPMGFVAYHSDSFLKKALMVADMVNPLMLPANFVSGKLPQQMMWIGNGFGKHVNTGKGKTALARAGYSMMRNPFYKNTARGFMSVRMFARVPIFMTQDAGSKFWTFFKDRFTAQPGEKKSVGRKSIESAAVKIGLASLLSGGTLTIPSLFYEAGNFLTNGGFDKIVKGTIKVFVGIAIVAAVVTFIVVYTNYFLGDTVGGKIHRIQLYGFSTGYFLPYKGDYSPRLVVRADMSIIDPYNPPASADCTVDGVAVQPKSRIEPKFSPTNVALRSYSGTGIDVSHWEGNINWSTVKSDPQNIRYAIMKATEGTSYSQEYRNQFKTWWNQTKAVGIPRSAYHFFRPDEDGYSQANYFLNTIYDAGGGDFGDFYVSLDVEMTSYLNMKCGLQHATDNIKAFLDQVEAMLGYKPMIYTSKYMWSIMSTEPSWAGEYPLWVAHYGASSPSLPTGWRDYVLWQYSSSGSVNGVSGAVDMNRWR